MRVQRKTSPLLLLLLASLAVSASIPQKIKDDTLAVAAALKDELVATSSSPVKGVATIKPDVGTKDAPVDGLDGKPHAGPWVAKEPESKKPAAGAVDLAPNKKKPVPTSLAKLQQGGYGGSSDNLEVIPEKNDGVMDDTNRAVPKQGTTGTEGGVSEKSKTQKANELYGKTEGKKPDPPKEAPPLPHSEQERIKENERAEGLETKGKEDGESSALTTKLKGAVGLEV